MIVSTCSGCGGVVSYYPDLVVGISTEERSMTDNLKLEDQPAPTQDERSQDVWARTISFAETTLKGVDFTRFAYQGQSRDQIGRNRYGTSLKSFNGRNALVDAAQENLDGCAYLTQAWMECEDHKIGALEDLLTRQIILTADILALLDEE